MQNTKQKFKQSSIVFEKPGILSQNFKTLTSSNYPTSSIFFAETLHTLPMSAIGCVGLLLLHLDLELFAKIKKDLVSTHSLFILLLITQDLNKIKKSDAPFCRHYQVENVCKISAKNIKLYGSWSSSKFSIFQTKNLVSWK